MTRLNTIDNLLGRRIVQINECWVYTGYTTDDGYGLFSFNGMQWLVHRLSFYLFKGNIPPDLWVLHTCDNRPCFNPDHLYLGTHQDNMNDRNNRNRQARQYGSLNGRPRLNEEDAVQIKLLLKTNQYSLNDIAKMFDVCKSTIVHIKMKRQWSENMPILYNCKHNSEGYRITKFDSDMNIDSTYLTSFDSCECPAGTRSVCRHRIMLPRFIAYNATHGEAFFDYDRSVWIESLTEASSSTTLSHEVCALCGCATEGEAALVKDMIWCHTCADNYAEGGAGTSIEDTTLDMLAAIPGVTILDLSDPAATHNTLAEALGEPTLPPSSPTKFDRRF